MSLFSFKFEHPLYVSERLRRWDSLKYVVYVGELRIWQEEVRLGDGESLRKDPQASLWWCGVGEQSLKGIIADGVLNDQCLTWEGKVTLEVTGTIFPSVTKLPPSLLPVFPSSLSHFVFHFLLHFFLV